MITKIPGTERNEAPEARPPRQQAQTTKWSLNALHPWRWEADGCLLSDVAQLQVHHRLLPSARATRC